MNRLLRQLIVPAASLWFAAGAGAADGDEAAAVIAGLQDRLVEVAGRSGTDDLAARSAALAPVVVASHDFVNMGRLTVRRFWSSWTDEQQQAFVEAFERLSVMTYASRFASVSAGTFEVLGGELTDDDLAEVSTLIHRADGDPVAMRYLMRLNDDHWRIINVFADGVSELSLMGSAFFEILDGGDFQDLMAEIESRIDAL